MTPRRAAACALLLSLAACASAPKKSPPPRAATPVPAQDATPSPKNSPYAPAQEDVSKRGDYTAGGLYAPHIQDSAPDEIPDVDAIPEPAVVAEPRSRYGNRSYKVLGKSYSVLDSAQGYVEQGVASYYGKKFHGRRTSSLEVYDMYAFSAAHKSLPLPSYARVTNLANGKSVVVRVNDRGPFHAGRIIDLSYAAAVKLGVHKTGVAKVEVRGLTGREDGARLASAPPPARPAAEPSRSAIDTLVGALPIGTAQAAERPAPPAPGQEWRFDMRQDGRAMTADEFDAWMRARRARVATGKPGKPDQPPPAAVSTTASKSAPLRTVPAPAQTPKSTPSDAGPGVTLQVAAFAARTNAEHALRLVQGAGVAGARLQDGQSNGQTVWRLRVGPVALDALPELATRFAGLGFGQPQIVRE